jgi:hypothetical protein
MSCNPWYVFTGPLAAAGRIKTAIWRSDRDLVIPAQRLARRTSCHCRVFHGEHKTRTDVTPITAGIALLADSVRGFAQSSVHRQPLGQTLLGCARHTPQKGQSTFSITKTLARKIRRSRFTISFACCVKTSPDSRRFRLAATMLASLWLKGSPWPLQHWSGSTRRNKRSSTR